MTREEINTFNKNFQSYSQGIFVQPNHIPTSVKEPVVYMRWNSRGYTGGNCWDDTIPYPYTNEAEEFTALKEVCRYLNPEITDEQIKMIGSVVTLEEDAGYDREYYGNSTEYSAKWILLSKVEELVEMFKSMKK